MEEEFPFTGSLFIRIYPSLQQWNSLQRVVVNNFVYKTQVDLGKAISWPFSQNLKFFIII